MKNIPRSILCTILNLSATSQIYSHLLRHNHNVSKSHLKVSFSSRRSIMEGKETRREKAVPCAFPARREIPESLFKCRLHSVALKLRAGYVTSPQVGHTGDPSLIPSGPEDTGFTHRHELNVSSARSLSPPGAECLAFCT